MDERQIRAKLTTLKDRLAEFGEGSLSLFGSAAKGKAEKDSDLDFLVEFKGPATFDRFMGLRELLELEFDRPIDLVTMRALKPSLRDQILGEAVPVA